MKHILKILIDMVYLFPFRINKFRNIYPNDNIIAYGACKGIKLDSEEDVKRGLNWALSKRGLFILSDNRIKLNDWIIELNNVEKAELVQYRSGMILKIKEKHGKYYQFGLQYTRELLRQDVLKIDLIDNKVRYSMFSIILRVILVVYGIYILTRLL